MLSLAAHRLMLVLMTFSVLGWASSPCLYAQTLMRLGTELTAAPDGSPVDALPACCTGPAAETCESARAAPGAPERSPCPLCESRGQEHLLDAADGRVELPDIAPAILPAQCHRAVAGTADGPPRANLETPPDEGAAPALQVAFGTTLRVLR